jgi:transcriptional regulator GlxA family with amidase domain
MESIQPSLPLSIPGNDRAFNYYPPLRRVREYVEKNSCDTISLADAARVAAMETSYFSTFFHSKVGIPFSDWLRRIRVARAIAMIEQENHSICEVAFAVGFNDLRTFGRAFKRYTNKTPMTYKKACRP